MSDAREKWDARYAVEGYVHGRQAAPFLIAQAERLPQSGAALDIAGGEGQNAVFLAQRGLSTRIIDISTQGLRKARALAKDNGVELTLDLRDLTRSPLPGGPYQVILCFHYKQPELADAISDALAPGGILLVELCTTDNLALHPHPSRRFCVAPNELIGWFPALAVRSYREGEDHGRIVAQLVAEKPRNK